MLNPWIMLLVGLVLGWLLSWLLQRRLDDSLTGQVAQLQRELSDANRRLGELASVPAIEGAVETERASAAATIAALEEAEQLAPPPEAAYVPPEEPVVEATSGEEEPASEEWAIEEPMVEPPIIAQPVVEEVIEEISEAVADEPAVEEELVAEERAAPAGADDLTAIKGIGPKFAETLHAAGITTFAALAELSPERLEEIVQPAAWQKVDFADWVAQAADLTH